MFSECFPDQDLKFTIKKNLIELFKFSYLADCVSSVEHIAKEKKE